MSENDGGILEAICAYARRNPVRMHMPGHKGRKAFSVAEDNPVDDTPEWATKLLDQLRAIDVTEAPGLDNLHYPTGCIRNAERRAEEIFGSERTFFLVNGATSGIQSSLIATRMAFGPGSIVVPRNVHRSMVSAMMMSGLEPIFVWPEYRQDLGGYLPLDADRLKEALDAAESSGKDSKPRAVLVINPTYCGFARDLTDIANLCHSRGLPLLVDEAHGTHFAAGHGLPASALKCGADLVTHGAHKTTVAFTQTAFLHVGPSTSDRFPTLVSSVEEALRTVQTTSPSYILMSSIEEAVQVLGRDGGRWVDHGTQVSTELAERLSRVPGISVSGSNLPPGLMHDPSRVLVNLGGLSVSGPEAAKHLVEDYGVVPEMSGPKHILLLLTGATTERDILAAEEAFRGLSRRFGQPDAARQDEVAQLTQEAPRPVRVMPLRQAFLSVSRPVPVEDAGGRISADTVVIYPPGSPLVTPGERIDRDIVEYLLEARKEGLNVLGRGIKAHQREMSIYCVES